MHRKRGETPPEVPAINDAPPISNVAAVGNHLDGFVAEAKEALGIFEENFAGRSQLDGFGGAVQETGPVGLFELANLGADGRLRAKNFLAGARETL